MHPVIAGIVVSLLLISIIVSWTALDKVNHLEKRIARMSRMSRTPVNRAEQYVAPAPAYIPYPLVNNKETFANVASDPEKHPFINTYTAQASTDQSIDDFNSDPQLEEAGEDGVLGMIDTTSVFSRNIAKSNL